jgi:hypothetical protein
MVPESIRWLIAKKRYKEAKELILKASKVNKKSIPDHLLVIPNQNLSEQVLTAISLIIAFETLSSNPESHLVMKRSIRLYKHSMFLYYSKKKRWPYSLSNLKKY